MKVFTKILLILALCSCTSELPTVPNFIYDLFTLSRLTTPLEDESKEQMNGVYRVIEGNDLIGEEVACYWNGNIFNLYSNKDVILTEVTGGVIKDSILLIGNIRIIRSGKSISVFFEITPESGSSDIIRNIDGVVRISGYTSDDHRIVLEKIRENYPKSFYTIGHRGGCRNSERLGVSENSLEMIEYSEILGASGVEIDIKKTRDNELIIFHDDTFSPRTVKGAYLLGSVEHYDLAQIKKFGRLIHGEQIPTLYEALNFIIEKTSLKLVWLDIKSVDIVPEATQIQLAAIENAKSKGRDILILLGIPDKEILHKYMNCELRDSIPVLVELDVNTALSLPSCKVWAPRWTNGIQRSQVNKMHKAGKLVFTWTLDVKEYIDDFLKEDCYDGILTNYPSLVTGMYLVQQ